MTRKTKPIEFDGVNHGENAMVKDEPFYAGIAHLLVSARGTVYRAVNDIMAQTYWHVGQRIVEREQQGQERAGYGERLIVNLSRYLTDTLGKGFSEANLKNMRQFYLAFPDFQQFATHRVANLAWSHIRLIMRLDGELAAQLDEVRRFIRASERQIWQQITDIFTERSLDYDRNSPLAHDFYAMVQNKFHYAIAGKTTIEIIYTEADHAKESMWLNTWKNAPDGRILKSDVTVLATAGGSV